MNELVKYKSIFYMSYLKAERYEKLMGQYSDVKIQPVIMTDEFGLLFENGKILVVYLNEMEA